MEDKIKLFWENIAPFLNKKDVYKIEFVEKIDDLLRDFGNLSWEIGPDGENSMYLAISPSLDPVLHKITKQFIKLSPEIENWVFYDCKQKKPSTSVKINNHNGVSYSLDAKDWKFQLLMEENQKSLFLDIYIENEGIKTEEGNSVEILLINLIGEFNFMYFIYDYSVLYLLEKGEDQNLWDLTQFIKYIDIYCRENEVE